MSHLVEEITGAQLQALLDEGKTVVCDFWASWCGPCRMLAPVMESVAAELKDRAQFVKINVDEEGETAVKYGVMSIPNVFVFKKGEPCANSVGYAPENEMKAFLEENL
ncbi:MAG: thioredoxin [Candidatus Gallimonas sp.]